MTRSCATCKHHLGGGQCAQNLELECAAGEYEAWEGKRMISRALFTSNTSEWETPQWLFDKLNNTYKFTLDVCALPENAKCVTYYTPDIDGLSQKWRGSCWMNPPYGREIGKWIKKAYESAQDGATVVCLLPARTDTAWWHDYCMHGDITFLRGRLKFGNAKNSAPFPSAIVVFRGQELEAWEQKEDEP